MILDAETVEAFVATDCRMISFMAIQRAGAVHCAVKLKARKDHVSRTGDDPKNDFGSCKSLLAGSWPSWSRSRHSVCVIKRFCGPKHDPQRNPS